MSRRNARKNAFFLLFQTSFVSDDEKEKTKEIFFDENNTIPEKEKNFIIEEIDGVLNNIKEIDSLIEKFSKGWAIERISRVDLSILRLSIYEIKFAKTPEKISVNEAVELAKEYSSKEAASFINGILGSFIKERGI